MPRAWRRRCIEAAAGILADRALGEPSVRPHPVAAFGTAMKTVEARIYRPSRAAGTIHAATGVLLGSTAGVAVQSTAAATYVAVAGRSLAETALGVHAALDADDLDAARDLLPGLVGRDPTGLGAEEMCRAVVESVAENAVDAVVAPALWAVVGGAPGALGYRAINTLDAMVGHRNERYEHYGWASARLDDAANLLPSRVTALLVAAVRPRRAVAIAAAVRSDASGHPSPNSGVAEAAFAAALGIRLGGLNRYGDRVEDRPTLGRGPLPGPGDILRSIRLLDHVGLALAAALVTIPVTGQCIAKGAFSNRNGAS